MKTDVIGIENPVMDFNLLMDEIPATDSIAALHDYSWQGGGNVSSAIVAAARLGAKAGMAGIVGDDDFGRFCKADFERHGIDTSHVLTDEGGNTTFAVCLAEIKKMGRSFVGRRGTDRILTAAELDKAYVTSAKYIHMGHMGPVEVMAAQWARESGTIVVDDAGYFNEDTDKYTHLIDIFIASEHYYKGLFNNTDYLSNMRAIQKRGPKTVIVTLGAKGCVGLDGDKYFKVPAFTGVNILDTTGAGDVFHGAFICGMLHGFNMEKSAQFASAVSAIKCTRLGGRAAIPDYKMTMRFMEDGIIDYSEIDKRVAFYRDGLVNSAKEEMR